MNNEEKALIAYRMERAQQAIIEAKTLFDAGLLNAYVNRLYYACFYAVTALLLTKNLSTGKHSYLRSLMHSQFVKPGLIPKELGKHFDLLFNNRLKGDYGALFASKPKMLVAGSNTHRNLLIIFKKCLESPNSSLCYLLARQEGSCLFASQKSLS